MSLWRGLKKWLAPRSGGASRGSDDRAGKGLLVFHHTSEVIQAERCLQKAGFAVQVMGPPPDLRTGCDMILVFPLLEELAVRAVLDREGLEPLQIVPLRDLLLEPVSLFQTVRYGDFFMVRAANMKITVQVSDVAEQGRAEARIVNVSGGGCPDVPYLASLLVGRTLAEADEPRLHGRTLCSYSLQKAFEEMRRFLGDSRSFSSLNDTPLLADMTAEDAPELPPVCPGSPRSWLICGSVPDEDFPLSLSRWVVEGDALRSDSGASLSVQRGTPALLSAALLACEALGVPAPQALLAGDTGRGHGSRELYRHLAEDLLPRQSWDGLTFHYLFPDVDGHNRILLAVDALAARPLLVADAGFMYAAKMSGYASFWDLFTPDAGELAFLADEKAPHPFYTRGFLLAADGEVPRLAAEAAAHGDSAGMLLIKGAEDAVVKEGRVLYRVSKPCVPAMEPIGGTGDLVTGMATAFLAAGWPLERACLAAARANRAIGAAARPTPATGVVDLLPFVGQAVKAQMRIVSPKNQLRQAPQRCDAHQIAHEV